MQNWASRRTFISTRQRLNHDTQGWDEHWTAADFQATGDLLNKIFNRHRRQPHTPMERVSKRRRGLTLCHCITCKVKLGHPNQTILFLTGGEFQPHFIRRRFCCVPGFLICFQPIFHTGHVRTSQVIKCLGNGSGTGSQLQLLEAEIGTRKSLEPAGNHLSSALLSD